MQYTEEQIARANQTDLVSFLNEQGEQLVKSGREYRWKKHDSVTISGNRWYRHSQSKGGYPVDFVMEFYYATFPEAVKNLIGDSPWFYAAYRHRKSIRNILKFLKNISNFHKSLCSFADGLTENLFVFSFNNKDHLFEACADSIINGKINDDMSVGIDGVNLFQPAITAAHAGCHNYKYRFLHLSVPSLY